MGSLEQWMLEEMRRRRQREEREAIIRQFENRQGAAYEFGRRQVNNAAGVIQRNIRGRQARRRVVGRDEAMTPELQELTQGGAATRLQRAIRQHQNRRRRRATQDWGAGGRTGL